MERKVGEIFNANGTILQVCEAKESDECNGCFFEDIHPRCLPYICAAQEREDGKNVQFKEISKTMTREEAKRRAELYSALANDKTIQIQCANGEWTDVQNSTLICIDDDRFMYRVKPEPRYRPFRTQEDCWQEMLKHQPFGWLKTKKDGRYCFFTERFSFTDSYKATKNGTVAFSSTAFNDYTFADGTPFGMLEE